MADRVHYLHVADWHLLNHACITIARAFGTPYLVGSATERPDWRDVDLRVILPDDEWRGLFDHDPTDRNPMWNLRWSLICSLVSKHLAQATGLPVDFQIQSMTQANTDYSGRTRNPLGVMPCGCECHAAAIAFAVTSGAGEKETT